ncbi:PREDICTED: nucleolar protein 8 [Miniopterus natalensis]|uniref:nucleolar protein 8 n=1 Tax=Miniopterus natalensis TaxID=291302 RepID=UPI0007A6E774|nr:PREDICTED: nucleolar protein 8 [Miniopterus natalensis]
MKANRETKRLFVGGLGQSISEMDLQNQFSRFGEVSDVEIITRKDDQGNPQKVFAYINIRVAETDLKKCMSVLNNTKWKGGTLQIQLAKESFLHRLAREREEAKAKKERSTVGNSSLSERMGMVDFPGKAVPGTEVPGHKNWVVSKFGRVLPVLHLKNQHKRKIKYDPSKYCHNLKKIGEDFTNAIPISNLTWELEGRNDLITKKRRGKLSDLFSPPKKMIKVQRDESCPVSLAIRSRPSRVIMENPHLTQQQTAQEIPNDPITLKSPHVPDSDSQKLKSMFFHTSDLQNTGNKNSTSDDINSKDELRLMITREGNLERTTWSSVSEPEYDPSEVVRDDFKSDGHKLYSSTGLGIKNNVSCLDSEGNVGSDCSCDSGDREDTAMNKNTGEVKKKTELSQMEKSIYRKTFLKNKKTSEHSDHCIKVQKRKNNVELAISHRVKHLSCKSLSSSSSSEDADPVSESAKPEEDESKAMMKNCLHMTLTLADLGHLAGSDLKVPKEGTESDGWETTSRCDRASKSHRTSGVLHRGRQCIYPEEIVASLLEGEQNTPGKQKPKENNLKLKIQAFKGVGCLYGKESVKKSLKENAASSNINKNQNSLKLEDPTSMSMEKGFPHGNGSSSKLTPFQCAKKADDPNHTQPQKKHFTFETQNHKVGSPRSSEKGNRNPISSLLTIKDKKSVSPGAEAPVRGSGEDCCHRSTKTGEDSEERPDLPSHVAPEVSSRRNPQGSKTDFPLSLNSSSDGNAKDKHAEDNQKRLSALEARQKAKDTQKKLVHNALANLDGPPEDKPTHIIFGSDSESETEEMSTREQSRLVEKPVKELSGRASGKLFDSSSDEESDPEDDSNRFRIKPQFEGRAGKKLMDLQSHFGTDDRFRMDSRFLESDSEEEQEEASGKKTTEKEELAAEKLKALDIVQSILHTNLSNSTSKGSVAAKKFKDIIHYDPTRHEHATYEKKRDDKPKESKAKRKKKREEAEQLPVVSKEMYYNIAVDLKEIFQTANDTNEKKDVPYSMNCDEGRAQEAHDPVAPRTGAPQPGGFIFSFFDSHTEDGKEETYRVETVKRGKAAWQGTPRFQDSSSEEEDVNEETDDRKPSPGEVSLPEKETTRFFFFSKNDERLLGSDLFWRGMGDNISRNSWEARTNNLRMDCRKKHKDAKRRVKPK